jgi:hypothetical protein
MAERVGNPVPDEIRDQLERHEQPLVYELVTRPKDPGTATRDTWAGAFATAIARGDQHELLLTQQRLAVVTTDRRDKQPALVVSVPLDALVAVEPDGSGLERGRIRFAFRDGSETHGVMGIVMPRPARRFLAAYESTTPKGRRRS